MHWMTKTVLTAALGVVGTGIVYCGWQGIIMAGDARWVQQSAVDRAEVNRLEERKADLKWSISHERLTPEARSRKETQLETIERSLKRYQR